MIRTLVVSESYLRSDDAAPNTGPSHLPVGHGRELARKLAAFILGVLAATVIGLQGASSPSTPPAESEVSQTTSAEAPLSAPSVESKVSRTATAEAFLPDPLPHRELPPSEAPSHRSSAPGLSHALQRAAMRSNLIAAVGPPSSVSAFKNRELQQLASRFGDFSGFNVFWSFDPFRGTRGAPEPNLIGPELDHASLEPMLFPDSDGSGGPPTPSNPGEVDDSLPNDDDLLPGGDDLLPGGDDSPPGDTDSPPVDDNSPKDDNDPGQTGVPTSGTAILLLPGLVLLWLSRLITTRITRTRATDDCE